MIAKRLVKGKTYLLTFAPTLVGIARPQEASYRGYNKQLGYEFYIRLKAGVTFLDAGDIPARVHALNDKKKVMEEHAKLQEKMLRQKYPNK